MQTRREDSSRWPQAVGEAQLRASLHENRRPTRWLLLLAWLGSAATVGLQLHLRPPTDQVWAAFRATPGSVGVFGQIQKHQMVSWELRAPQAADIQPFEEAGSLPIQMSSKLFDMPPVLKRYCIGYCLRITECIGLATVPSWAE